MRKNMKRFTMVFTVIMLVQGFTGVFDANNHNELTSSISKLNICSGVRYESKIDYDQVFKF